MSRTGGIIQTALAIALVATPKLTQARDIRVRILKHVSDLRIAAENVEVDEESFPFATITPEPKRGAWLIVSEGKKHRIPFGPIEISARKILLNQEEAPRRLQLHVRQDNAIDVVAFLPLDEYLKGVVPSEMPGGWPSEALKAQAIAARSYAYRRMLERQPLEFDVESSVIDQQFKFTTDASPKKVLNIISQTKDMVLVDDNKSVFEALYHADCGGMTETTDNVWGGKSNLETRADSPHRSRHWQVELERQSLVNKFTQYFGLPRTANLRSLQAVGRSPGGRVKEIRVDLSDAGVKEISSQEFRKIVGYDQLPSANFQMSWWGKMLHIAGLGQGHGVGLCQLGARAMAEQGKNFREILEFYYPRTHLTRLNF